MVCRQKLIEEKFDLSDPGVNAKSVGRRDGIPMRTNHVVSAPLVSLQRVWQICQGCWERELPRDVLGMHRHL